MKQNTSFPEIKTSYPHVVVRVLPGIYVKKAVVFTKDQPTLLNMGAPAFIVHHDGEAFTEEGNPTDSALESLMQAVEAQMQSWGWRCCVVLGKEDCIYLEFGKKRNRSKDVPSGGVQLDHLNGVRSEESAPSKDRKSN